MNRYLKLILCQLVLLMPLSAQAVSDDQYNAIVSLGKLNAVALHCRYHDETRRMKGALINALPKRRQLGDAFEMATHEAFLKFIENQDECPESKVFTKQVDQAIEHLQEMFH